SSVAPSSPPPMSDQASWPSLDAAYPTRRDVARFPLAVMPSTPPSTPPHKVTARKETQVAHGQRIPDQSTTSKSPETPHQPSQAHDQLILDQPTPFQGKETLDKPEQAHDPPIMGALLAEEPEDGQKRNENGLRLDVSVIRTRSLLCQRRSEGDSKSEEQRADGQHRNDPAPNLRSPHPALPNTMTMTAKTETDVALEDNMFAFGWDVRKWVRATCNTTLVRQKIMQTDFTDQASAKVLSDYLQKFARVTGTDISLGTYRGMKYELIPEGMIDLLLDEVEKREGEDTSLDDLAPTFYRFVRPYHILFLRSAG
ncbi:MAG: hypothetical protein M1826_004489, partial [Phylliscum demangeonii]